MNIFRKILWFSAILSFLAVCGSFILQYVFGMNPCVLCILQRLTVLAVGGISISMALSNQRTQIIRTISVLIVSMPTIYGAGVAIYQLWIQSLPPETAPSCGAPWSFRLREWPLFDYWEFLVRGFGNCSIPDYLFGITLPIWSLLYFLFILTIVWFAWFKARHIV